MSKLGRGVFKERKRLVGHWRENPGGLVTRGGRGDSDLDLKSECRGDGRRCVKMALRENDAVGR